MKGKTELPLLMALSGGAGSRLVSVWANKPKVLVPVAGRPYFDWFVDAMYRSGFRQFLFLLGFRADLVEQHIAAHRLRDQLDSVAEDRPLGTGGAVRCAFTALEDPRVFVANADSYCRIDYPAMLRNHLESGAHCTIAILEVDDTSAFGRVEWDGEAWVQRFSEKAESVGRGYVNAGVYILERDCLSAFPAEGACSIEKDVFPRLAAERRLGCFHAKDGELLDIGTPERLERAQTELARLAGEK